MVISLATASTFAQISSTKQGKQELSMDSLRKKEENAKDSIVHTAKHVRYTLAELLKDSTQLIPLDTAITNFQNYSPINQPKDPSIGLGGLGLPYRDLLFNPSKTIGFNAGFHALDRYRLTIDSVHYYRAQSPYTELYYVDGGFIRGELFRVTHAQNITPGWNFGGNYNRIAASGTYINQNVDHLNAALFTWYESRNKRYMLLATTVFNNMKAAENGSVVNDSIFTSSAASARILERTRLSAIGDNMPRWVWKDGGFFLKQFYYIGKRDSVTNKTMLLPRQRISYATSYTDNQYQFFRNEPDNYGVFPLFPSSLSLTTTDDRTQIKRWSNEFAYSFYLRGKSLGFVKNEVKLDVGVQYDWYDYQQGAFEMDFDDITLKAVASYRFSDRVSIQIDLQHIAEGKHVGDFFYDAKVRFLFGRTAGRVTLGAYSQNKSPEQLFERVNYQFHQWDLNFSKTQINNLSFLYENPKFQFAAKAECFLLSNYLYYQETTPKQIIPTQVGSMINLLKFSVAKNFKLGRFHLDNYVVYQKSSDLDLLSTPNLYTYNSFYYEYRLFKVLLTNIGFDVRYHTLFEAPAYAINVGQFYNNNADPKEPAYSGVQVFDSFPVVDVWLKANLKRVNFFFKYEYINQGGPFAKGYYSVNRYPMQDGAFKMGISWKFYN